MAKKIKMVRTSWLSHDCKTLHFGLKRFKVKPTQTQEELDEFLAKIEARHADGGINDEERLQWIEAAKSKPVKD